MNWKEFAQSHGARFGFDATGLETVLDWGNSPAEYQAARNAAALIRRDDLGVLELTGNDRAKFLHNFCTNDIKRLAAGSACEAFACNVKGRILAYLLVVSEADRLMVYVDRSRVELLHKHLDRYLISEDVTISDQTATTAVMMLRGPKSDEVLERCLHSSDGGSEFSHVRVQRWEAGDEACALIAVDDSRAVSTWQRVVSAGATPAGWIVADALRIEARLPRDGVDISDEYLAQEANRTESAISFTKGCYLGQEPIARLDALGHVNRILSVVQYLSTTGVPARTVLSSPVDGSQVGTVSSSQVIPGTDRGVALATVKAKWGADGTKLSLATGAGTTISAVVIEPK